MARLSLGYLGALARATPPSNLIRAAVKRLRPRPPAQVWRDDEIERAAAALTDVPRLFCGEDPRPLYTRRFAGSLTRARVRAERILDGEVEIFGAWRQVGRGAGVNWQPSFDLDAPGADPKPAWELGRSGHLVELAAAGRLHGDLTEPARAEIAAQIGGFLDANPVGQGLHFRSPLEVAMRGVHWAAALELSGGVPAALRMRMARSLLEEGAFLLRNLEDGGACPANHLLGDWVGLLMRGLWVGRRAWVARATAGLRAEAARQVGDDGAHFEASTAYHRFALELILIAHRWLGGGFDGVLKRMLHFVRGYSAPDGSEPGFGDGDDAHLIPLVPRTPRDHSYLLGLGVALLGETSLKPPGMPPPEELVWWSGAAGIAAWDRAAGSPDAPSASFPQGGVHVLRSPRLFVALRAGGYGQEGVGGHAHNDQLSLVVHAGGRPLIVDPGTASYTADPVARDRFRGTAAHATVVVGGEEQSPLFDGRPFALPDRAHASATVEDCGEWATLRALHHGYQRLPAHVTHRRRVTLHRELDLLMVEDELDGRGTISVEVCFPLAERARLGASPATRERVMALAGRVGSLDVERAVEVDGRAALLPLLENPLTAELRDGWWAPHFGTILPQGLVRWTGLLNLPQTVTVAVLLLR